MPSTLQLYVIHWRFQRTCSNKHAVVVTVGEREQRHAAERQPIFAIHDFIVCDGGVTTALVKYPGAWLWRMLICFFFRAPLGVICAERLHAISILAFDGWNTHSRHKRATIMLGQNMPYACWSAYVTMFGYGG